MQNSEQKPPIYDHRTKTSYGRRTFNWIVGPIIAILLVGAFVIWYFFPIANTDAPSNDQSTSELPMEAEQSGDMGQSAMHSFFYEIFSGIDKGLEDNSMNKSLDYHNARLNNSEPSSNAQQVIAIRERLKEQARSFSIQGEEKDGSSVFNKANHPEYPIIDLIGSDVYSSQKALIGKLHDILIDKDSGLARSIIIENDGKAQRHFDASKISYQNIFGIESDGDIILKISENRVEDKPNYTYEQIDRENIVSLRLLKNAEIYDYTGAQAGQVEALFYDDASLEKIYFTLKSKFYDASSKNKAPIKIFFSDIKLKVNDGMMSIQLSKEQTETLADFLF